MPDRYELVIEASGYVTAGPAPTPEPTPEPEPTENEEQDR